MDDAKFAKGRNGMKARYSNTQVDQDMSGGSSTLRKKVTQKPSQLSASFSARANKQNLQSMESLLQDKCNVNMKDIGKKASQMQISQGSKHSRSNLYENRSQTKSIEILKNQYRDQATNDEKDSMNSDLLYDEIGDLDDHDKQNILGKQGLAESSKFQTSEMSHLRQQTQESVEEIRARRIKKNEKLSSMLSKSINAATPRQDLIT